MAKIYRTLAVAILALAASVLLQSTVEAQQNIGPNPVIGDHRVSCGGVTTVIDPNLQDLAVARMGFIGLSPAALRLPSQLQLFVYAHECAHFLVGSNEAAADCWAIRTGIEQDWFQQNDLAGLQQMFGNSLGDWTHKPGPARVADAVSCFHAALASTGQSNVAQPRQPSSPITNQSTTDRENKCSIEDILKLKDSGFTTEKIKVLCESNTGMNTPGPTPTTNSPRDSARLEPCFDRCESAKDNCSDRADRTEDRCSDKWANRFLGCTRNYGVLDPRLDQCLEETEAKEEQCEPDGDQARMQCQDTEQQCRSSCERG